MNGEGLGPAAMPEKRPAQAPPGLPAPLAPPTGHPTALEHPARAEKAALRRHYRRLRRELRQQPGGGWTNLEEAIAAAVRRQLPAWLGPDQWLGLYWPLPGEVDLQPLAAAGIPVALPAVEATASMAYRPWSPADPLAPDGCGIPAPLAAAGNLQPAALAVLLVPALAFDPATGIRLGSGGGWYDRLRADPAWAAVPALAVLPAHGLHPGLPREPWDLPFGGWLDGEGLHGLAAV